MKFAAKIIGFSFFLPFVLYSQQPLSRWQVSKYQEHQCDKVIYLLSDNKVDSAMKFFDTVKVKNCRVLLYRASLEIRALKGKAYPIGVPSFIDEHVQYSFAFCDLQEIKRSYYEMNFLFREKDNTYKIIGLKLKDQEMLEKEKHDLQNNNEIPPIPPPGN